MNLCKANRVLSAGRWAGQVTLRMSEACAAMLIPPTLGEGLRPDARLFSA